MKPHAEAIILLYRVAVVHAAASSVTFYIRSDVHVLAMSWAVCASDFAATKSKLHSINSNESATSSFATTLLRMSPAWKRKGKGRETKGTRGKGI